MGENANRSGKEGEEKAKKLLSLIGWGDLLENHEIKCNKSSHLNEKGKQKSTHGVDLLYTMNNPFHDNRTDIVVISAKHTIDVYPPKDYTRKQAFKSHLEDLQHTIECAQRNSEINAYINASNPKKNKEFIGVLFWLQSDHEKSKFQNMKSKLSNIEINQNYKYPVYLIDNHTYGFIESVLNDMNARKSQNNYKSYKFYAPSILGPLTTASVNENRVGRELPLEILSAGILIFHVIEENNTQTLILYSSSIFTEENYRKMLAYGLRFSENAYQKIKVGMLGYNETLDKQCATRAQIIFRERDEECSVFEYSPNQMMGGYKIGEDDHE